MTTDHAIETEHLRELISRLEALTGPDREVDGLIALHLGWRFEVKPMDSKPYWREPGQDQWWRRVREGPPHFTKSIDAALRLVPDGLFWLLAYGRTRPDEPLGGAQIVDPTTERVIAEAEAETPAIALCSAATKARLAMAEKE